MSLIGSLLGCWATPQPTAMQEIEDRCLELDHSFDPLRRPHERSASIWALSGFQTNANLAAPWCSQAKSSVAESRCRHACVLFGGHPDRLVRIGKGTTECPCASRWQTLYEAADLSSPQNSRSSHQRLWETLRGLGPFRPVTKDQIPNILKLLWAYFTPLPTGNGTLHGQIWMTMGR